ncbi:DUF799 domain-containing protein [Paraburkholderia acidisoli]|uniref:Lipoprotein n=1 Tax=Paraburkholderia acidisoli TaxID=2571748 RepID=A0A7Z2GI95_9BURK|nr:DUF799 domain-containing protein [Paraburkholderia acidisoli]QGZ62297.1 hypothetical protein FAZ98_11465 [Paraburkholderia acidisoli]
MFDFSRLKWLPALAVAALLAACAGPAKQQVDYTALRAARPHTIVVLPPLNETSDVNATNGMLSQMTMPLAEAGYYVLPVAEVAETFKQNGLTTAADIQDVSPAKLRKIFGADAALYTKVTQYGSVYQVVDANTFVTASAKLVGLANGDVLWEGKGSASGKELGNYGVNGGLITSLVQAAVKQVAHTLSDESWAVAGLTSRKLLSAGQPNGLLYGPRSPKFGTD